MIELNESVVVQSWGILIYISFKPLHGKPNQGQTPSPISSLRPKILSQASVANDKFGLPPFPTTPTNHPYWIIVEISSLLRLSQLLLLLPFNSFSASINRVWTHILYRRSPLTLSQLSSSVRVVLICWFTCFSFVSSAAISSMMFSSTTTGREYLLFRR